MPWIVFIHTLCQTVLHHDAPDEVQDRFTPAYERLLTALGVPSYDDLAERQDQLRQLLPDLSHAAGEIIAANPHIVDDGRAPDPTAMAWRDHRAGVRPAGVDRTPCNPPPGSPSA